MIRSKPISLHELQGLGIKLTTMLFKTSALSFQSLSMFNRKGEVFRYLNWDGDLTESSHVKGCARNNSSPSASSSVLKDKNYALIKTRVQMKLLKTLVLIVQPIILDTYNISEASLSSGIWFPSEPGHQENQP